MQKVTFVFLLMAAVLLSLLSCRRSSSLLPELLRADSLCECAPDRALLLLDSLRPFVDARPQSVRMHYALLRIKAADKADVPITSDSAIRPVLRYYEHGEGDPLLLPEALYYGGRTYRELGDAPQALDYFNRAINALPDGVDDGLKSNIYSQRGQLFIFQDMYPEAREMFRASLECDLRIQDSVKMVYALRDIGFCFYAEDCLDSARHYYKDAYSIAKDVDAAALQVVQIVRGSLFMESGQYDSAWIVIEPYFHKKDINLYDKSVVYSIALEFYQQRGNVDSMLYCANALLDFGTIYAQKKAYYTLVQHYLTNEPKRVPGYWKGYIQSSDSVDKLTREEAVRKADALYNYNLREQEARAWQERSQNNLYLVYSFILAFVCIVLFVFFLLERSRRIRLSLQMQLENVKRETDSLYFQSRKLKAALEKANQSKERVKRELQQQEQILQRYKKEEKQRNDATQEAHRQFLSLDIYKETKAAVASGKSLPAAKMFELRQALEDTYGDCVAKLFQLHVMEGNKLLSCLLLKAGFSIKEIALLENVGEEAIRSTFKRISRDIWPEDGTYSKLKRLILSL